jgi:hypothetical protein
MTNHKQTTDLESWVVQCDVVVELTDKVRHQLLADFS